MTLNKIYKILGSLLFLDLIVLVDIIFNLSIFIFGAGSVLGIVKIVTNLMTLMLGLIWIFTKDDKWSKYMHSENEKSWTIAKNMLLISAHLQSSVFKLSKDLIDSIHEEGIVAYTS